MSPSVSTMGWGPGLLRGKPLLPGTSIMVKVPLNQCYNDMQVHYSNGAVLTTAKVYTCNLDVLDGGYTANASGMQAPYAPTPYTPPPQSNYAIPPTPACVPKGSCSSQCSGIANERTSCISSCMLRECR
jgi:hypothetical protein